jgi:hypothetical protein
MVAAILWMEMIENFQIIHKIQKDTCDQSQFHNSSK